MYDCCSGFCCQQRDVEPHALCPSFQFICCLYGVQIICSFFFLRHPRPQVSSMGCSPTTAGGISCTTVASFVAWPWVAALAAAKGSATGGSLRRCGDNFCRSRSMRRNCVLVPAIAGTHTRRQILTRFWPSLLAKSRLLPTNAVLASFFSTSLRDLLGQLGSRPAQTFDPRPSRLLFLEGTDLLLHSNCCVLLATLGKTRPSPPIKVRFHM